MAWCASEDLVYLITMVFGVEQVVAYSLELLVVMTPNRRTCIVFVQSDSLVQRLLARHVVQTIVNIVFPRIPSA